MSTQTDWEKVARAIALLLVLGFVLLFGAFWVYHRQLQRQPTGKSVTVAFIADGGMTDDSHAVLQLIHREDADILVHSGDFDYHNDPAGWDALLNETLGSDFPVVATIGNHDRQEWAGYRRHLAARTDRAEDLHCTGDLGLHSTCTFRGVTVVQSSDEVCSLPSGDDEEFPAACGEYGSYEPEQYVRTQLEHSNSTWNVCSWHYPNHAFQVGEKSGVSLDMYDTCREAGGDFVVTGHDHAYARSYPMRDFDSQTIADRSNPYVLGNGSTMALVTGASGHSFYEPTDAADAEWWAKTHTSGEPGAFFCRLRANGTGTCYFETIDGETIDGPFDVQTSRASTTSGYDSRNDERWPRTTQNRSNN